MTFPGSVDKRFVEPPTPSVVEQQTSAWAEVNKQNLGIVKDSIEQVLTQLNPRFVFGYIGGFGYKTSSSRPLLDHNLDTVRMAGLDKPIDSTAWKSIYDDLVAQLPPELQQRFLEQAGWPLVERNFIFVVLDNILTATARALAGLEAASRPVDPGSLEAARTVYNLLLPVVALNHSLTLGEEIGQTIQDYIMLQGPNSRDYDTFMNALTQMHAALGLLNQILISLKQLQPGEELKEEEKAKAAEAADRFNEIADQLARDAKDESIQALDSSLRAIAIVAYSLSLPFTGTAPLYMGLSMATIGIKTSQSQLGFIGPEAAKVIDAITDGILSRSMPEVSNASTNLTRMLLTAGFSTAIGLASQAAQSGLGPLPGDGGIAAYGFAWIDPATLAMLTGMGTAEHSLMGIVTMAALALGMGIMALNDDGKNIPAADPADLEMARFLTFSAALQLASSSNFIDEFFKEALVVAGGNEKAQKLAVPILSQITSIVMALAGTGRDRRYPAAKVLEGEADRLEQGVKAASELTSMDENSEAAKVAAVTVGQLQRALQEQNYEGFLESLNTILEGLGSSQSAIIEDIHAIRHTIETMIKSANDKEDEHTRIGIVNVV